MYSLHRPEWPLLQRMFWLANVTMLVMKMHSYVVVNRHLATEVELGGPGTGSKSGDAFPANSSSSTTAASAAGKATSGIAAPVADVTDGPPPAASSSTGGVAGSPSAATTTGTGTGVLSAVADRVSRGLMEGGTGPDRDEQAVEAAASCGLASGCSVLLPTRHGHALSGPSGTLPDVVAAAAAAAAAMVSGASDGSGGVSDSSSASASSGGVAGTSSKSSESAHRLSSDEDDDAGGGSRTTHGAGRTGLRRRQRSPAPVVTTSKPAAMGASSSGTEEAASVEKPASSPAAGHSSGSPVMSGDLVAYPHNVTLRDFLLFSFAPTLVYEPNFPRTTGIRPGYLLEKVFLGGGLLTSMAYVLTTHVHPVLSVVNSLDPLDAVGRLLLPLTAICIMGFFLVFEVRRRTHKCMMSYEASWPNNTIDQLINLTISPAY